MNKPRAIMLKAKYLILIALFEKHFGDKGKYLYLKSGSDKLVIIFSAFNQHQRKYNYLTALDGIKIDKLYIMDNWAKTGSYYMYENGFNYPQEYTQNLINQIASRGRYRNIYTAGTSMGGTCAIYYGLKINAEQIFAGACQYNIGSFVHRNDHEYIFKAMMGDMAGQAEADLLNSIMPQLLEKTKTAKLQYIFYIQKMN